jgi:hypothetical protein
VFLSHVVNDTFNDRLQCNSRTEVACDSRSLQFRLIFFTKSIASKARFGGIALAARNVVRVLDACDMNHVILESSRAGQLNIDVKNFVNTTIVVAAPQLCLSMVFLIEPETEDDGEFRILVEWHRRIANLLTNLRGFSAAVEKS